MTRDIRDPIEVYKRLMYEKTAWNCGILEAADRLESTSLTTPVTTNGSSPMIYLDGSPRREKGAQ